MAVEHQSLQLIVGIVNEAIIKMTNQAYAANHKFSYKLEWFKGTAQISDGNGKPIKNYYGLKFYMIDKNKSLQGKEIELLINYYPVTPLVTINHLKEQAYKEFLFNSMYSLFNATYSHYLQSESKEYVSPEDVKNKQLFESIKPEISRPKLII